jgi:hypothetical protein
MKYMLTTLIACFAFLTAVPVTQAEELQDFLKRVGIGNASTNDLHEDFHIIAFVGGQTFKMDRDEVLRFWGQQKASGIKLVVNSFAVLSETETPDDDGKGAVISIVAKTSVTEDVRGSINKIESTSHFIVLRDDKGAFHLLYATVPKQVRHVS